MIDDTDRQILAILQADSRTSNAEIARAVGMAPSGTLERLRKLEKRGVVRGYEARLCTKTLGVDLLAFIFVRTDERVGEWPTAQRLAEIQEVQEVHHIAGEDCYLIKVRVRDPEALGRLLREDLGAIETIHSTRTTIVLETIKETAKVPVAAAGEAEADA